MSVYGWTDGDGTSIEDVKRRLKGLRTHADIVNYPGNILDDLRRLAQRNGGKTYSSKIHGLCIQIVTYHTVFPDKRRDQIVGQFLVDLIPYLGAKDDMDAKRVYEHMRKDPLYVEMKKVARLT